MVLAGALLLAGCSGSAEPRSHGPAGSARAARPVLDEVGSRYVGDPIPLTGATPEQSAATHELVLQRFSAATHAWSTAAVATVRGGAYRFPDQRVDGPGTVRFRTVLHDGTRTVASNVVSVEVVALPARPPACAADPSPATCPKPEAITEQRTVRLPDCPALTVTRRVETGTDRWHWVAPAARWVRATRWTTLPGTEEQGPATMADCVHVVDRVPRGAALPDLRIKDLTRCGRGDRKATGGTCFTIVASAPYDADFPDLQGRKLLKFAVITMNVGAGPAEVVAGRSGAHATDWKGYQSFRDANGTLLGSTADPAVRFYFAGDGHEHWHVRDFDDYQLLDASGSRVARAEKHGYCMQDDTTYDPIKGRAGVPSKAVYEESTSCGKGLTDALTIVHGLSPGWGDTYPTSLPDQAIDITGLPDGVYTVRVHADALDAVKESDERNNVAEVKVRITGDEVRVLPETSAGGLP